MTIAIQWILGLLLALALLKLVVVWLQPRLAFYPTPGPTPPPPGLEAFATETEDGIRITGWKSPLTSEGPVLIYFCGNAGNLLDRTFLLSQVVAHGGEVVAFNYRGYGLSGGSPSEQGVYRDAGAVYRLVTIDWGIDPGRVVLWGHSIGGAVAANLAASEPCAALILESTFRSAKAMAGRMMPLLPAGPFLTYQFDNESHVQTLQIPILFIHGADDHLVPPSDTHRLHALATGPKELWLVDDAGHNDLPDIAGEEYYARILEFAQRALTKPSRTP